MTTQNIPSKHVLTSILTSLQSIPPLSITETKTLPHSSVLKSLPEPDQQTAKNVLLTLHFLFPHELLPALDLIDRKLITHLYTVSSQMDLIETSTLQPEIEVYYVQSASSSSGMDVSAASKRGRFRNALSRPGTFYEVRLDGWNCSCPAFAYSSLKLMMKNLPLGNAAARSKDSILASADGHHAASSDDSLWLVGGVATIEGTAIPICKHILAVTITKAAPILFGSGVTSRAVSKEELAGWAAGWGEH